MRAVRRSWVGEIFTLSCMEDASMPQGTIQIDTDPESETEALGPLPKPGNRCGTN